MTPGERRPSGWDARAVRVSFSPSQTNTIGAALERVTQSGAFRSSRRAQEFLRHIVVHALRGETGHLKERSIGCDLFGRAPDYDTGSDALVRVTANDVRKRLGNYYTHEGATDTVRFEVPVGSYVPEVLLVPQSQNPNTPSSPAVRPPSKTRLWPAFSLSSRLILAAGAISLVAFLIWVHSRLISTPKELRALPWSAMFHAGHSPQLVLGDSAAGSLLLLFGGSPMSLDDYANRHFPPQDPRRLLETQRLDEALARSFTGVADARIAGRLSRLAAGANRASTIRFAREMRLSEFHDGLNLILLGSPPANPWVGLFQDQKNFNIRFDPVEHRQFVAIDKPKPGAPHELADSVGTGMTGPAYAVLTLISGLEGKGKVLIAEGTNMEGTEVAADLMFDSNRLSTVLENCGGVSPDDPNARFEVLIELQSTANSTSRTRVLATRCNERK